MKARKMLGSASYDPETLAILYKAFDDAWAEVRLTVNNDAVEAARIKLAELVLELAAKGARDPQLLKDAAVQLMFAEPRKLRP